MITKLLTLTNFLLNLCDTYYIYVINYIKLGPFKHRSIYKEDSEVYMYIYKTTFINFLSSVTSLYNPVKHSIDVMWWLGQTNRLFKLYLIKYSFLFNYYLYLLILFKTIILLFYIHRVLYVKKSKLRTLQQETPKEFVGHYIFLRKRIFGDNLKKKLLFGNTLSLYIVTFIYCSIWTSISGFYIINDPFYFEIGGYSVYFLTWAFYLFFYFFISVDILNTLIIIIRGIIMLDFFRVKSDLIYYWKYDSFFMEIMPITLKALISFLFFFHMEYWLLGDGNNILSTKKRIPNTVLNMLFYAFNTLNLNIIILVITKGCLLKIILYVYEFFLITTLITSQAFSLHIIIYLVLSITVFGTRMFYGTFFNYQMHKYIFKKSTYSEKKK